MITNKKAQIRNWTLSQHEASSHKKLEGSPEIGTVFLSRNSAPSTRRVFPRTFQTPCPTKTPNDSTERVVIDTGGSRKVQHTVLALTNSETLTWFVSEPDFRCSRYLLFLENIGQQFRETNITKKYEPISVTMLGFLEKSLA